MDNKKNIILSVALLLAITISFVLFFGIGSSSKTDIQLYSFIFVLLTELIIYGNIFVILNKKLNTFMIAGLSSTTFLYSICSLIFNIIVLSIFSNVRSLIIFNISILLIYLFINTIIILFKKESK